MNLLTELESYLKRYIKRKQPSKTVTQQQNKQKNSEKKGRTQGTASERAKCYLYKLPDQKFSAEDEKYYSFTP